MPPILNSLPFLVIGGVMAAYWYRVIRMARKQRKQTGKAGNLLPPERLGRLLRVIWFPVVVIWIVHPLLSGLKDRLVAPLVPLFDLLSLRYTGAAIVAIGFVATRRCWKLMGRSWRMGIDPAEKTGLVFDGPFAYVRHPIYSLSALMMLATMLALPSPAMLVAGVTHIALLFWESAREERYLVSVHGSAYSAYQQHVGRIVPRSARPYRP